MPLNCVKRAKLEVMQTVPLDSPSIV